MKIEKLSKKNNTHYNTPLLYFGISLILMNSLRAP